MTIWLLALTLTAIACATLYYAGAGRTVNAGASITEATNSHFRAQLRAIDVDAAAGRMGPAEAEDAKGELAREVLKLRANEPEGASSGSLRVVWLVVALVAVLSLGTYAVLGRPDLPSQPLADRAAQPPTNLDPAAMIEAVEAHLKQDPGDLRGWQLIAPIYMQLGRYADAAVALRQVNALQPPTADTTTDLGEALMMQNGGSIAGEPLSLFRQAAALDPKHVRSRYYIAGEETRAGDYAAAVTDWTELLALAKGDEPWVVTAKSGLALAQQGLHPEVASSAPAPDSAQIDAMVDGLDARLKAQGGSIEEWTQLVRSRMVQGRMADAQAAYDAARKAYPDAKTRTELDVLAADNGLVARP